VRADIAAAAALAESAATAGRVFVAAVAAAREGARAVVGADEELKVVADAALKGALDGSRACRALAHALSRIENE